MINLRNSIFSILILIFHFIPFNLNGQNNINNRKSVSEKIKEITNTSLRINTDTTYRDTIFNYEILLKGNSYFTKTSSQINILMEDPKDLSYMLVYGPSDPVVFSIAIHWSKLFKSQNPTFKLIDLYYENYEGAKIEKAKFKIKKYGKKLTGEFWTYDTGENFYILHIFTIKGKWDENNDIINQIFNSFKISEL
jgi:hypothetical protein